MLVPCFHPARASVIDVTLNLCSIPSSGVAKLISRILSELRERPSFPTTAAVPSLFAPAGSNYFRAFICSQGAVRLIVYDGVREAGLPPSPGGGSGEAPHSMRLPPKSLPSFQGAENKNSRPALFMTPSVERCRRACKSHATFSTC